MELPPVRRLLSLKTKRGRNIRVGQEIDIKHENYYYGVIDRISIYPQFDGSEEIKVRVLFNADGLSDEATVLKDFTLKELEYD